MAFSEHSWISPRQNLLSEEYDRLPDTEQMLQWAWKNDIVGVTKDVNGNRRDSVGFRTWLMAEIHRYNEWIDGSYDANDVDQEMGLGSLMLHELRLDYCLSLSDSGVRLTVSQIVED
jgi:hypothetical protein